MSHDIILPLLEHPGPCSFRWGKHDEERLHPGIFLFECSCDLPAAFRRMTMFGPDWPEMHRPLTGCYSCSVRSYSTTVKILLTTIRIYNMYVY